MGLIVQKSTSVEHYSESIKSLDVKVIQLSKGEFYSKQTLLNLDKMMIGYRHTKAACIIEGASNKNFFSVAIPCSSTGVKVNGHTITSHNLLIASPSEAMLSRFSENARYHTLTIPMKEMQGHWDEGCALEVLEKAPNIRKSQYDFTCKKAKITKLIDYLINHYNIMSSVSIADAQEDILSNIISMLNATSYMVSIKLKSSTRHAIVKRAVEYINSQSSAFVAITDVARESFCSLRSLEYAFKSIYNLSPKQYLILRRLHFIRRDLMSINVSNIKELVQSYGVENAGRFSRDYASFFGEYPKETYAKARFLR